MRKRVLFLTEATYLSTGYATYGRHVLDYLNKTNKYNIAEFSVYGQPDHPERKNIKWKNYPNMPLSSEKEQMDIYKSHPHNQFGEWRFERVCLDFKPDVVLLLRDYWMDSFVFKSPFRRIFKTVWMPTVDAAPQAPEWLHVFGSADGLITYSDWAMDVLRSSMGENSANFIGTASPSAEDCFKPVPNKKEVRDKYGINPDIKLVGTVMRNQRRKLFPALLEALSKTEDIYLLCHTSYPDNGWELDQLLRDHGVANRVLFTYKCSNCGHVEIKKFNDAVSQCSSCKKFDSRMASVTNGVSSEQLADIYNLMDVYVQCANSEGFGLPQVEAAACNIPIISVDYSAMSDVCNKLNARKIKYSLYKEMETGCERAVPDVDSLADQINASFENPINNTRELFEKHYSWEKTSQVWEKAIDSMEYADWSVPPIINNIDSIEKPKDVNNQQFIRWCMNKMLGGKHTYSYFGRSMLRDLNYQNTKAGVGGFFYSDMSAFGKGKEQPFSHDTAFETIKSMGEKQNFWEKVRSGQLVLKNEEWLK